MALTPAEQAARSAGYATPEGTHYISEGDDAIRRNAVRTHQDIADAAWWKPVITSASNLDNLTDPGLYPMQFLRTASELGIPVSSNEHGFLEVAWQGTPNNVTQTFHGQTTPGETWQRKSIAGVWDDWYRPPITESRRLDANADLDNLTDEGWYIFTSTSVPAQLGLPVPESGVEALGVLEVRRVYTNLNYVTHRYRLFTGGVIGRTRNIGVWSEWAAELDGQDMGARHAMLKDDFTRRYGTVNTEGRAAIALRFDHGLTNFKNTILPLLRARDLTATVAMNSRTWDAAENSGATQTEADSWTDIEFANHSATHTDAPTYERQVEEIVTGRAELAAQLPNHAIDGWLIPGVGETQYGGFGTGTRATDFADSTAGQLILGHHAWSSGHIAGTKYRTLDGVIRSGEEHYTIENKTVAQIRSEIDAAISRRAGLSLMMHPRVLNTSGYLTTAQLTQVLDYIAAKRDAGDLVNLTLSEMMVADSDDLVRIDTTAGHRIFFSDVMVAGETGQRNMTGSLLEGWRGGAGVSLSRSNDLVTASIDVIRTADGGTFANILDLPAGFVPATSGRIAPAFISITLQGWLDNLAKTRLRIRDLPGGLTDGDRLITTVMWTTRDPWPTTLPGTPA